MKAVIFDLDGLLIDSEPVWYKANDLFLKRRGFAYTPELQMEMMGTGQKEAIAIFKKKFKLNGSVDGLIKERKTIFYNLFSKDIKLMQGVPELLEGLKSKNMPMAIATGGHPPGKVKEILQMFNLRNYFSVIVSSDQVKRGKPYPDVYLFTSKLLSLNPDDCLVLEDTANGVLSGKAAGMSVIGVNSNLKMRENLLKAGAQKVYSNLSAIKNL